MGKKNRCSYTNSKMVAFAKDLADFNGYLGQTANGKLLVVDFTASWCPPCKMIAPHFDRLSKENPDVIFIKVDVDDAADVASELEISSMPTFKFFKSKVEVSSFSGASLPKLESTIAKYK